MAARKIPINYRLSIDQNLLIPVLARALVLAAEAAAVVVLLLLRVSGVAINLFGTLCHDSPAVPAVAV